MNDTLTKGFIASVPLITLEHIFLYLANRSGMPETFLAYLKPIILGIFVISAIAVPAYFCTADRRDISRAAKKMIGITAICWIVFACGTTFTAFVIYPGLTKEIETNIVNVMISLSSIFLLGFPVSAFACFLVALIARHLLPSKEMEA